jgi:hypothetical protein
MWIQNKNSKAKGIVYFGTLMLLLPECLKHWSFHNSAVLPQIPTKLKIPFRINVILLLFITEIFSFQGWDLTRRNMLPQPGINVVKSTELNGQPCSTQIVHGPHQRLQEEREGTTSPPVCFLDTTDIQAHDWQQVDLRGIWEEWYFQERAQKYVVLAGKECMNMLVEEDMIHSCHNSCATIAVAFLKSQKMIFFDWSQ